MAIGGGLQTFARTLAHAPYQGDDWQRYLFVGAIGGDACLEKLNQGMHGTLTGDSDASALPYIAAQRGNILRGLTESDDSYRARLRVALDDLRIAGSAWSVLRQSLGFVLASQPRAFAVSSRWASAGVCQSSTWDQFATGASTASSPRHVLYNTGGAGNWDWDSLSPTDGSWGWWRWYLCIEASDAAGVAWVTQAPKWGSGVMWGSSRAWGINESPDVGRSLRIIISQWKANWCHWIIVSFDSAWFDPAEPAGLGINPDGYFGRWSKVVGGVYVRARFADACYFEGEP